MIHRDDGGMLFAQVTLMSFMHDGIQMAFDILRVDLRWGEPKQRALLAFHYVRHEPDRWSVEVDFCYLRLHYDAMFGFVRGNA